VRRQRRAVVAQQTFGRRDSRQLVGQLPSGKAGGDESARRKLDPRQARRIARRHGRQELLSRGSSRASSVTVRA